ncbi:hypothetical protein ACFO1S_10220 [Cohnella boryungensis]|uniref:Large polyvalent protein-associated domain-containing protein n=2 Tax=Cohnella boryungensis TaxID=768479 RepID=A0ABV8SA43_9BACL
MRIADLVIVQEESAEEIGAEHLTQLLKETLANNTIRQKQLFAFVNVIDVTTSTGQFHYEVNSGNGELTLRSQEPSNVVETLKEREPDLSSIKDEELPKAPELSPEEALQEATKLEPDDELNTPQLINDRIELVQKHINDLKKKAIKSTAETELATLKTQRGAWLRQENEKIKNNRSIPRKKNEDWENDNPVDAGKMILLEKQITEAKESDGKDNPLKTAEDRQASLQTRLKQVTVDVKAQEDAKNLRSQYVKKQLKDKLTLKYKEYDDSKYSEFLSKWEQEDSDGFEQELKKHQLQWESENQENGQAALYHAGVQREREGSGRNQKIKERKQQNKAVQQKAVEEVKKDNSNLLVLAETLVDGEASEKLAVQIGHIKEDTGNRKAVNELLNEVAQELSEAQALAEQGKIDKDLLGKFVKEMCSNGEYVNFRGNLAELRHAVLAARSKEEGDSPVYIGSEEWEPDKEKKPPQEVDVSYKDKTNTLHLREVAWDIATLEDKLFGSHKESQREGYARIRGSREETKTRMAYAVDQASDSDKALLFSKIPKDAKGNYKVRGGMAQYLIDNGITVYLGGEHYTIDRLKEGLETAKQQSTL